VLLLKKPAINLAWTAQVYDGESGPRLHILTVPGLLIVTAMASVPTSWAAYTVACADYKGTLVLIDPYGK
jgi:hypothetical protein